MKLHFKPVELPLGDGILKAVQAGAMTDVRWLECRVEHSGRLYSVIQSRDNIRHGLSDAADWRWHISVAGEEDVPRWEDLTAIVHNLRPGIFFCVGMPPESMWMNLHPPLHVHQIKDANLIEQFRHEGKAAQALGLNKPT